MSVPGPWGAFVRISVFTEDGLIGSSHYVGRQEDGTRQWETVEYVFEVPIDAIRIRVELFWIEPRERFGGMIWLFGSFLLIRFATGEAAEAYGAEVNPTGNPIGGGEGYARPVTGGDIIVSTGPRAHCRFGSGGSGRCHLCSTRGRNRSDRVQAAGDPRRRHVGWQSRRWRRPGPLLFSDEMDTYPLFVMGTGEP